MEARAGHDLQPVALVFLVRVEERRYRAFMMKNASWLRVSTVGLALLALAGCEAAVGTSMVTVPKNSGQICANHCRNIGMRLSAVAIMANNVGCVCQPAGGEASADSTGELSTPAAGMSTIAAQQAAAMIAQQQTARRQGAYH